MCTYAPSCGTMIHVMYYHGDARNLFLGPFEDFTGQLSASMTLMADRRPTLAVTPNITSTIQRSVKLGLTARERGC